MFIRCRKRRQAWLAVALQTLRELKGLHKSGGCGVLYRTSKTGRRNAGLPFDNTGPRSPVESARSSVNQLLFDLFEGVSLGFRQSGAEKDKSKNADGSVTPKRSGRTERFVERRKGVSQDKTGDPKRHHGNGHRGAADPVGKDFGNNHP